LFARVASPLASAETAAIDAARPAPSTRDTPQQSFIMPSSRAAMWAGERLIWVTAAPHLRTSKGPISGVEVRNALSVRKPSLARSQPIERRWWFLPIGRANRTKGFAGIWTRVSNKRDVSLGARGN
jgi:hypothetical protein